MEILKLFILCLSIINAKETSLRILSTNDVEQITSLVTKELESKSISADKRYSLLFNLAEDLRNFRFLTEATSYYQQALAVDTSQNKIDSYLGLINIAIQQQDSKITLAHISSAKEYLKKNPKYYNKESEKFLDALAYGFEESSTTSPEGMIASFAVDEKIKTLIKSQKHEEALSFFKPEALKANGDELTVITFDLLNYKVSAQKPKLLYCQRVYDQRPNAYTYTAILCGLLKDKMEKKENAKSQKRAAIYFAEDNKEHAYLFDLYKEIK